MSYTKGPWETDKGKLCYCVFARNKNGDRIAIATSDDNIVGGSGSSIKMPEKLANARLIASAPELLEACKEYIAWFDKVSRYQDQRLGHGLKEACQNWKEASQIESFDCSKMKQAIAKAEGK